MVAKSKAKAKKAGKDIFRSYTDRDIKLLFGLAAMRCAMPDCQMECVATAKPKDRVANLAKICHIIPHSDTGPRCDPSFPKELRGKYENLILLCGTCHDKIDLQPNFYTADKLRDLKKRHEEWVSSQLTTKTMQITYQELELVTKAILTKPPSLPSGFGDPTPPDAKIAKNNLSPAVHNLIATGMLKQHDVQQFVQEVSTGDVDFPERLRKSLRDEYDRLWGEGVRADELFLALCDFACQGKSDLMQMSAGLAVVVYFFNTCDLFEP